MATNNKKISAQARREAALAEAERLKAAQATKARRNKLFGIGGSIVGVVAIVVVAVLLVMNARIVPIDGNMKYKPTGWTTDGGIAVGKNGVAGGTTAGGVVTMEVWSDYMCSACDVFETAYGTQITQLVDSGQIKLIVHPVSFLDTLSKNTKYSTRASAAAAAVAMYSPDQFLAFHSALYKNYPGENTPGLTDAKLVQIAQGVEVNKQATDQFGKSNFNAWVKSARNQAIKVAKIGQTPTVRFVSPSGQEFTWAKWNGQGAGLTQAIASVQANTDPNS